MRFLLYNMRYGAGAGALFNLPFPGFGYLRRNPRNLRRIIEFIRSHHPDIVGLVEIDGGSYLRSNHCCQAELIAGELGHYHLYQGKYAPLAMASAIPLLSKQGNAILSRQEITGETFHYFEHGMKRLVIEATTGNITVFLVHLSLKFRHRQHQLDALYELLRPVAGPCIVAGDFNVFWGDRELRLFAAACDLVNANAEGLPSYPSRNPSRQLDFIFHSRHLRACHFEVPHIRLSDHCPLICDFELN